MMAYRWIWHTLADPYAPKPGDEAQGALGTAALPKKNRNPGGTTANDDIPMPVKNRVRR